MTTDQIIERINHFFVEDFEVEEGSIIPQNSLKDTLDLDSLDYVDLVVSIEQNFGFKVKPEDFQSMVSVQDFYDYVIGKVNSN
jgi:acyl carrier protein